jgi:hypothetical protein
MFIPDPGSDFFPSRIQDPIFFHPGSRIHDKESEPRILIFYPSRIQGSKRHRIPDPQHCKISLVSVPDSGHEEAGVESVSLGEDLLLDLVDLGLYGLLHLGGADHHAYSATLLQLSQVQLLQQTAKLQ